MNRTLCLTPATQQKDSGDQNQTPNLDESQVYSISASIKMPLFTLQPAVLDSFNIHFTF